MLSCFVIGILLCVFAKTSTLAFEPDGFWHMKMGEWMLENHQVMSEDVYSWVKQGNGMPLETFSHSWLGSIIIFLFSKYLSVEGMPYLGVYIYEVFFFGATLSTLLYGLRKDIPKMGKTLSWSTMLVLAPAGFLCTISPRPQMIGHLIYLVMLLILRSWGKDAHSKGVYWLPVIAVLWANIHGGTAPIMILFCLTYLICGMLEINVGQIKSSRKKKEDLVSLSIATGLSAVTMMINPYGYRIYTYGFVFNNAACKEGVGEWFPATIHSGAIMYMLLIIAAIIILSKRKISLYQLIPVGAMGFMSLLYVRGGAYLGLAAALFVCETVITPMEKYEEHEKGKQFKAICFVTVLVFVIFLLRGYLSMTKEEMDKTPFIVDDEIVAVLQDADYERMYNSYDAGGYLIYKDIPVFIDSRADLYPEETLRDGKNLPWFISLEDIDGTFRQYDFDAVLIENRTAFRQYMEYQPDYQLVLKGNNFSLFEKQKQSN